MFLLQKKIEIIDTLFSFQPSFYYPFLALKKTLAQVLWTEILSFDAFALFFVILGKRLQLYFP